MLTEQLFKKASVNSEKLQVWCDYPATFLHDVCIEIVRK